MNSVYIDSAVASSPIYLGPTNASSIIIGNTNCTTYVNGLPFNNNRGGTTLVGYNVSTASNASIPTGIEIGSTVLNNTNLGGVALIDFHTNQKGFVDYDARISATGGSTGTAVDMQASLNYYAAGHNFAGPINMGQGSNIGLQSTTGYVTPSAGMLGCIVNGATPPASTTVESAKPNIVSSISLTETGIYMFSAIVQIATNSVTVSNITWISLTVVIGAGIPLLLDERLNQLPPSTSYGFGLQVCGIVSNIGTNTYNLKLNTNFTGGAPAYTNYAFSYKAVRIA